MRFLRAERALEALRALQREAESPEVMGGGPEFIAWKGKVRSVFSASLGNDDHLLKRLDAVRYRLNVGTESTTRHEFASARHRGIRDACGVIDAAIFQLSLLTNAEEPVDEGSFDPELWAHIANLVADEDWTKVASQTAIFVEDRIKRWAGNPKNKNGDTLYGKALYASVLCAGGTFQLGNRSGESEGWLFLGMGFAQALGNVDRHNIQNRADARRYALGVLGVGSLLLTQLRFEYGDLIGKTDQG